MTKESVPREAFRKRIERLLAKVEAWPELVVERKTSLSRSMDVYGPVRVRIEAIWVFGSYARGAPLCGDVDLIIMGSLAWAGEFLVRGHPYDGKNPNGWLPSLGRVISPLIGPLRGMVVVSYDDLMRHLTVLDEQQVMQEAVLLWAPGMNWKAALDDIKINPAARRADRPATTEESERIAEERDRQRSKQ